MTTFSLDVLKSDLEGAGFRADWHDDPDDPCLLVPGGVVVYPDGTTIQSEWIAQHEWPAILIIAKHVAPTILGGDQV